MDIESRVKARVEQLIAEVGDKEFRRGVAGMTGFDTAALGLDDVICVYVLAKQGWDGSPQVGRRAAVLHQTLPGRTDDDAGLPQFQLMACGSPKMKSSMTATSLSGPSGDPSASVP